MARTRREPALPYGAGTTRHMSKQAFDAVADTLRNVCAQVSDPKARLVIDDAARALAVRFAASAPANSRFRPEYFVACVMGEHDPGGA